MVPEEGHVGSRADGKSVSLALSNRLAHANRLSTLIKKIYIFLTSIRRRVDVNAQLPL